MLVSESQIWHPKFGNLAFKVWKNLATLLLLPVVFGGEKRTKRKKKRCVVVCFGAARCSSQLALKLSCKVKITVHL